MPKKHMTACLFKMRVVSLTLAGDVRCVFFFTGRIAMYQTL